MSVLILQGPQANAALPDACATSSWAGHDVHTIRCDHADALIASLRAARANDVALVVLDGGDLHRSDYARSWPALRAAIDELAVPYIELHDASGEELEPWLHPRHLPLATLVTLHDRARGYAMSQAIAARRLAAGRSH